MIRSNGVTVHLSIHQDSGTLEQSAIPQGYGLAVVAEQVPVRDVVTKIQREVVLVRAQIVAFRKGFIS